MSRKSGPIPNRWLHCPRKANELIVGKILAFKTPLSSDFDDQVSPEHRFYPEMVFGSCNQKKLKIGLWIDLTNTSRFYDRRDIERNNCAYVKFACRGHGETPTLDQTDEFISLVHNFIAQHPLQCIAVHCTHGFNRTGFLIVSYLFRMLDMGLDVALEMFAKARPPGIYKGDYLEELYNRHGDPDDIPPPPELPRWCFDESEEEDEVTPSNGHDQKTNDSESSGSRKNKRKRGKRAVFMEGVPGVTEFTEHPKAFSLKKMVQQMCEWKLKDFPGSQPVSMDKNNIKMLSEKPYRVSWKADGTRYMMLINGENEVYFLDRNHDIFAVEGLRFPCRKDLRMHLKNTLLDGEMVIDKVGDESIPRYLAYDIIKFEGKDVGKMPFYPIRLHCIENEIIRPRHDAMANGVINKASEPFSVRNKQFWDITQAGNLLGDKFAATLSHEPDGLIFQPSREPYKGGRCDDVLKWKPPNMNSVDFKLKIAMRSGVGIIETKVCLLYVGQSDDPIAEMKYRKSLKDMDGKIVECYYENGEWKFMRERTDKSYPNSYSTAKAVIGSIANPITKEKLLNYIQEHRYRDDTEMMPPPNKRLKK